MVEENSEQTVEQSAEEKRNANLTPFPPGVSGNPNGRPKGRKSLAMIIRELENEEFNWKIIPKHGKKLEEKLGHIGAPFRAIVMVAALQAVRGNPQAREWLRRAGYGDKLDVTSAGRAIKSPAIISVIGARNVAVEAETTESS